jgi:hypothetical protein
MRRKETLSFGWGTGKKYNAARRKLHGKVAFTVPAGVREAIGQFSQPAANASARGQ